MTPNTGYGNTADIGYGNSGYGQKLIGNGIRNNRNWLKYLFPK